MVTFLFSVHTITKEAKLYVGLGRAGARAVDLPARSFDLVHPGVALLLCKCRKSSADMNFCHFRPSPLLPDILATFV